MQADEFKSFLKKRGKKQNVVAKLVAQIERFEKHLRPIHLEAATTRQVKDYLNQQEQKATGAGKKLARGIALYYLMLGQRELATAASDFRHQAIAITRKPFKLAGFRGVDPRQIPALSAVGIVTVDDMLEHGKTKRLRKLLAAQTGIPEECILELVKLSDLSRLGAIKSVRARLYHDAGIDTPDRMAQWEPEAMIAMLKEFIAHTGFDGIAPLPKEARNAIEKARTMPRIVEY